MRHAMATAMRDQDMPMFSGPFPDYSELSVDMQRLALAAAAGGVGIWDYDIDADVLYCDARWYEILGIDPSQRKIESIDDFRPFIHPDDVARATEVNPTTLAELVAHNEKYENVFRIIRPDGSLRWLRSAACIIAADHGRPRRAIGFVKDITERRLAEERLQESVEALRKAEARLREANATLERCIAERTREYDRVWTHSRDLQVIADTNGTLRAVSPAWTQVLGHQPEEVVGRNFRDFIPPEDLAHTEEVQAAVASGLYLTNFQNRVCHKDGSLRWIAWHTAFDEGLVYAYGRDVTAEKSAISALERSEARLRTMFETSYQHQILLAPDGLVVEVNPAALQSIGLPHEQVVGMEFAATPWFSATPGMPELVRDAVQRCAAGATVHNREIEVLLPGGLPCWFEFTLRPIRDSLGDIVALAYEAVDLTERRRVDAALRQAQKMEAVGQLTGGIAHDFNNLLQGITVPLRIVQQLLAAGRTDDMARYLDSALASTERAAKLARRLLDFSREKPQATQPVTMSRLIGDLMELLRQSVGAGIDLQVKEYSAWPVSIDASQFENVLLNLCINARDAMAGCGTIVIETHDTRLAEPAAAIQNLACGDYVCLRVIDNGIGMNRDVLERAFDPFFTTKGAAQGTGLGLFMVYDFARKSGGAVNITSEPGKGTVVEVLLPRHTPATAGDDVK